MPAGLIVLFLVSAIVALPFASCPMTPEQEAKWRTGIVAGCLAIIIVTVWSWLV